MQDEAQKAFEKAVRSLSLRAHSEKEIVEKLKRARFDERAIAQAMARLYEYQLLDDEAFARQWTASRLGRGMGPWRIARELRDKGIDREIIDSLMLDAAEDEDLMENAVALAQKHLARGDQNARKRAFDAMVRRGYGYDTARAALQQAMENLQEEAELDEDEWVED